MAMFEILSVAGGALVGHQWRNIRLLATGTKGTAAGASVRLPTSKEVLVRTGSGAVAGLGLATKSIALTGCGAAGVVFSKQLTEVLRLSSKASAQQHVAPTVKTNLTLKHRLANLRSIARKNALRGPPEPGLVIGQKVEFVRGKPSRVVTERARRIPNLTVSRPPPPEILTRATALKLADTKSVIETRPSLTRAQKLGVVPTSVAIGRVRRPFKKGLKLRRRPRRRNRRGLLRDKSFAAVVPTAPRPLIGSRIDLIRRPAFG